jgi:hypothetical protein
MQMAICKKAAVKGSLPVFDKATLGAVDDQGHDSVALWFLLPPSEGRSGGGGMGLHDLHLRAPTLPSP